MGSSTSAFAKITSALKDNPTLTTGQLRRLFPRISHNTVSAYVVKARKALGIPCIRPRRAVGVPRGRPSDNPRLAEVTQALKNDPTLTTSGLCRLFPSMPLGTVKRYATQARKAIGLTSRNPRARSHYSQPLWRLVIAALPAQGTMTLREIDQGIQSHGLNALHPAILQAMRLGMVTRDIAPRGHEAHYSLTAAGQAAKARALRRESLRA